MKNTPAHKAISDLVNDVDLQERILRCRNFLQTSALENFHAVLLKYLPKRLHFGDRAFLIRAKLAVMDWEHNYKREIKLDADGRPLFRIGFPASANDFRVKYVRMPHSFDWAKKLMTASLAKTVSASLAGQRLSARRSTVPEKTLVSGHVRPNRLTLFEKDYRRRRGEVAEEGELEF